MWHCPLTYLFMFEGSFGVNAATALLHLPLIVQAKQIEEEAFV